MAGGELGKVFLDPLHMDVRQDQWEAGNNCLGLLPNTSACPSSQTIGDITYNAVYNITSVAETNNSLRRVKVDIKWNETLP